MMKIPKVKKNILMTLNLTKKIQVNITLEIPPTEIKIDKKNTKNGRGNKKHHSDDEDVKMRSLGSAPDLTALTLNTSNEGKF